MKRLEPGGDPRKGVSNAASSLHDAAAPSQGNPMPRSGPRRRGWVGTTRPVVSWAVPGGSLRLASRLASQPLRRWRPVRRSALRGPRPPPPRDFRVHRDVRICSFPDCSLLREFQESRAPHHMESVAREIPVALCQARSPHPSVRSMDGPRMLSQLTGHGNGVRPQTLRPVMRRSGFGAAWAGRESS
jgi:hypothetical protein